MGRSVCSAAVNARGEEIEKHGTALFPVSCFEGDLREAAVPWHWHSDFELVLLTEGSALVYVNALSFTLHAGEGIFINAGALHALAPGSDGNGAYRSLVFHPRLIGSADSVFWEKYAAPILQNRALPYLLLLCDEAAGQSILRHAHSAWESLTAAREGCEIPVRNELTEIAVLLANQCQNAAAGDGDARSAARIKAMLLFIESHYAERISIDTLAREALLSQSEALRCFHAVLNTTPSKYIQQYRLEKAAALLKKSDLTTTEIAMECGFQSSSYFIKTFRAYTGFAPRAYRKAHISCADPSPIL